MRGGGFKNVAKQASIILFAFPPDSSNFGSKAQKSCFKSVQDSKHRQSRSVSEGLILKQV
jgi:hypothetical protein